MSMMMCLIMRPLWVGLARLGSKNAESRAHPRDDEDAEDNLVDADLALDEGVDDGCGYYGQHADHDLVEDTRLTSSVTSPMVNVRPHETLMTVGMTHRRPSCRSADVDSVKTDIFSAKGHEELVAELIAYAPSKSFHTKMAMATASQRSTPTGFPPVPTAAMEPKMVGMRMAKIVSPTLRWFFHEANLKVLDRVDGVIVPLCPPS